MIKTYTCKFCNAEFQLDSHNAGAIMKNHTCLCDLNPNKQHYLNSLKETLRTKYLNSIKSYSFKCKICGKNFKKQFSPKRYLSYLKEDNIFCSRSCANTRKHSEETKKKISNSLLKNSKTLQKEKPKFCKDCTKELGRKNKSGYCRKCIHKYSHKTPKAREKQRQAQLKLVKNGQHQGWKSRNISSYPEDFWKTVLDNNQIDYEFNYPIPKKNLGINDSACYFLDFKIGSNIDLEIDGKQHQYEERKNHDKFRDEVLTKYGWKVYRIPWNEINSENGKEKMKKKIDDFLTWYKSF